MNEAGVWNYVKRGMKSYWSASRIENKAGNGVPDVSFAIEGTAGWIELKYRAKWPVRESTPVSLPLRPEQKIWFTKRSKHDRNLWGMMRIEDHFFLIKYKHFREFYEGLDKSEWLLRADKYWVKRIDFDELAKIIRKGITHD